MSKLQSLKKLWNYAFNNKVINTIKATKSGKASYDLIIESNRAPINVFKGIVKAYNTPKYYQNIFNKPNLNSWQKTRLRTIEFGRFLKSNKMKKVYKDPAQIGAVMGRCIVWPPFGTTQIGYLLGLGAKKGINFAHYLAKRTQNVLI